MFKKIHTSLSMPSVSRWQYVLTVLKTTVIAYNHKLSAARAYIMHGVRWKSSFVAEPLGQAVTDFLRYFMPPSRHKGSHSL